MSNAYTSPHKINTTEKPAATATAIATPQPQPHSTLPTDILKTSDQDMSRLSSNPSSSSLFINPSSITSNTALSISIPASTSFISSSYEIHSHIPIDSVGQPSSSFGFASIADTSTDDSLHSHLYTHTQTQTQTTTQTATHSRYSASQSSYSPCLEQTHNSSTTTAAAEATSIPATPTAITISPHSLQQHPQTAISSADYALSIVLEHFERLAKKKMSLILNMGVDAEVDLRKLLGKGADPSFDKLISSLALLAVSQQKAVIDAVMKWRKEMVEPLDASLIKRISESAPLSRTREVQSVLKERQSLASVYILCRSLIDIVRRFTAGAFLDDLGENLEKIVFAQLKKPDPEAIKRSANRTASMDLFAELIGELSNIRFASVSDRFIAELEKYNSHTIMKERQSHMEMLIRGMRFLKIKIYPLDALEETADFLSSCASFFKNAHGAKVKYAYAELFVQLLLPIAEVAVAEVNFPAWVKAVDLMYPRALKMAMKPRHVMGGFPLVTTLLCVSRKEFFASNWLSIVENCYQKFSKDKGTRQIALGCISRLIWTYLFRCTESVSISFKKMDTIIKTIFPPFRRAIHPAEIPLDHFILITYFTLMKDVDTAMKKVIYYLLSTENTSSVHWEVMNPERIIIGLGAFRMMLSDLEKNKSRPPFPADPDMAAPGISITCSADVFSGPIRAVKAEVMEHVEETICKALMSLDQTFGRLLLLEEKNVVLRSSTSTSASTTTGTSGNYTVPMFVNNVSISGASDGGPQVHHQYATFSVSYTKDKQAYFDVLRAILDSIPRLMPAGIPLPRLVEMLSRYTVHIDPDVIQAASQAMLRIAAQIDSQIVVTGYSRFVYRIEDRCFDILTSLANGPLTGGNYNGNKGVMKLYVDLLAVWINQVDLSPLKDLEMVSQDKASENLSIAQTNLLRLFSMVEETEANGLLFLCNQCSSVRRAAIQIIKISAQLESRLIALLENEEHQAQAMSLVSQLSGFFSKSQKYTRIYHLLESIGQDLIKFDKDSNMLLGSKLSIETRIRIQQHQRRGVGHVLVQIAESDHALDLVIWNICFPEVLRQCFELFPGTVALCRQNICMRIVQLHPFIMGSLETMKAGPSGTLSMAKSSNSSQKSATPEMVDQWKVYLIYACATATLSEDRSPTATWASSGRKGSALVDKIATPRDLFRMTLQFLTCEHRHIREGAIQGLGNVNKATYKILVSDIQSYVRIVLLELTAGCLSENEYLEDKELMNMMMSYIKETKSFLSDAEVQLEWEYHKLRVSVMSFETRLSLYKMFEEWCGYGIYANVTRTRDAAMMRDVLEQCKDSRERGSMTQIMEDERKSLETAALSAMAMLCRGPLYAFLGQKKARQAVIQFDMLNVLRWIDAVFESHDLYSMYSRRALEAVLIYNQDQALLLDDIIEQCYAGNPKLEFTQGYFQALADIVCKIEDYPCHIHQIMSLALFKAGDSKKSIRKHAITLLRTMEERVFADSCAKEYEIGITSSLPAIYKYTQTLLSARLALDHPEQTYSMLSEISQRLEHITPNSQREVLAYMVPWLRKVDLSVGPQDTELSASAYMILSNLYYITIKFGDVYVKEIAALWSQLVDHGRNVRAIIMYLLDMGLEKRNPWFLIHAKRVFVCLGRTSAFSLIVEEVIAEITPRSMVPQLKEASNRHTHAFPLLFVADTEKVLPSYAKQPVFSRGQLAMVFLVDLAIEAGADLAPHLPLLLHSIFVQLDHLTSIVCDQSRCLLINLIHSIVIRQSIDSDIPGEAIEVTQWLASKEGKRLWTYENITPKNRRLQSAEELKDLLNKVIHVFSREDPGLRQKWGETALKWATCCSVRHIACRSFQCFRALMPAFNQHMLADMLARLSNTIADKSDDIRGFSLEIIITLTQVTVAMDKAHIEQFPQLFWAAVACLYSPYEAEHAEALLLLEVVLEKYGFCNELADSFPKNWSSEFDGLQPLLLKGLQFISAEEKTFSILSSIMLVDNPPLIDPSETRLMYLLLGCLPRLLHALENDEGPDASAVAPKQKSKGQEDFLNQLLSSMRDIFLTKYGEVALMFSILLVKNKLPHYREKALMIIENLVPYVTGKNTWPGASSNAVPIDIAALEPLLQLVQTDFGEKALSILNEQITAVYVEAKSEDSLMSSNDVLWGFSNSIVTSARVTRHNVHAVVFECSSITNEAPIEHNIQFSIEDFTMFTGESTSRKNSVPKRYVEEHAMSMNSHQQYGDDLMNALKDHRTPHEYRPSNAPPMNTRESHR